MSLQTLTHRAGVFSLAVLAGTLAAFSATQARTQADAPAQSGAENSAGQAPVLASNAPKSYTVKAGDTLWGISALFLRDPWLWPEIWYANSQVQNPHLIYPGDVLTLGAGADGRPRLTLERGGEAMGGDGSRLSPKLRSQPLAGAITAIPYEAVAAFMSKPMVLEKSQIKAAPHVVSSRDQHLTMAAGHTIYSTELDGEVGSRYSIVHVGEPMRDPEHGVVGYQGIYAAEAKVTRSGNPTTLEITDSPRETFDGDLLFPTDVEVQLDFIPHAPETEVDGRIMKLVNAISMAGQYQAVVINRGKKQGVEPGHVLAIYQAGAVVRDRANSMDTTNKSTFGSKVKLPDESSGTLMVFKVFERISYGLILQSQTPIRELDRVGNP